LTPVRSRHSVSKIELLANYRAAKTLVIDPSLVLLARAHAVVE
jgi:hypothetical protein